MQARINYQLQIARIILSVLDQFYASKEKRIWEMDLSFSTVHPPTIQLLVTSKNKILQDMWIIFI